MEFTGTKRTAPTPRWGEVYICRFEGTGSEQSGLRPAVIFQNNVGNAHSPNVIVLPFTTSLKRKDMPTHVVVRADDTGLRRDSMVICENPVSVSKDRLGNYITKLPREYMVKIAVASLLATSALDPLDLEIFQAVKQQSEKLNMAAA